MYPADPWGQTIFLGQIWYHETQKNYQKTGKQLMTEDEIAVMDGGKWILQIRGARPFFSDKYDITKHKNYRLLADENEKNRYKVEKELNPQYTPKSEEEVEVIHVELSE